MTEDGGRGPSTIGLLGGMSFTSTALYYQLINEGTQRRLGGVHSARVLLHSFDFEDVIALQRAGDWPGAGRLLGDAAERLVEAGAELLLICTNTMHKVAEDVQARVPIPLLDVIDVVGHHARTSHIRRLGLVGTAYTMQDGFYATRLKDRHGLETVVPARGDQEFLQRLIFERLAAGVIRDDDREELEHIVSRLAAAGAEATVLACTELELLEPRPDIQRLLATTRLHADAAVDLSLRDGCA